MLGDVSMEWSNSWCLVKTGVLVLLDNPSIWILGSQGFVAKRSSVNLLISTHSKSGSEPDRALNILGSIVHEMQDCTSPFFADCLV